MTLISAADVNRALGLPETSTPTLLNGWVTADPVALWRSGAEVRIAGAVKNGPAGSAAFELDKDQRPTEDHAFAEVVVSAAGEVVVNGGPDAQVIEAAFNPANPAPTGSGSLEARPSS